MNHPRATLCTCCETPLVGLSIPVKSAGGDEVEVVQCDHCAAFVPLFDNPVVNNVDEQLAFHEASWQNERAESLISHAETQRNMVRRLREHLGDPTKVTVAEIGCGRGILLKSLILEGYKASGCEPSKILSDKAREAFKFETTQLVCQTSKEFCQDAINKGKYFDAVILWHVIEHLSSPIQILAQIKRLLAPHGRIVMQVPLLNSHHVFREHLFLCNRANMLRMASLAGLNIVHYNWSAHEFYATVVFAREPGGKKISQSVQSLIGDWHSELFEIAQILITSNKKMQPQLVAKAASQDLELQSARTHSTASVLQHRRNLKEFIAENGPQKTLVGLHIPKCAGTSVLEVAESNLAPEQVYQSTALIKNWHGDREEFWVRKDFDLIRFVWGHWLRDQMLRVLSKPVVFTGMRDPRERIISAFHFEQRLRAAQGRPELDREQWLPTQKNYISRFIVERFPGLAQGDTMGERAQAVLRCFHGVYFTDNLQSFSNRLFQVILQEVPTIDTKNQRVDKPVHESDWDIPEDVIAQDQALYNWARETFFERDPLSDPIDKNRMDIFCAKPVDVDSMIGHAAREIAEELSNFGQSEYALRLIQRRETFQRELSKQVSSGLLLPSLSQDSDVKS